MTRRALGAGVLMVTMAATVAGQYALRRGQVVLPDKTVVHVEIADTAETRQRGLMFRESMADNAGMVFVFPEPAVHPFWMKNTLIPLDMIWVDSRFKVVAILEAVPCKADPCPNYDPEAEAAYVVELNRGMAKRHGLAVGATLAFRDVPEPARARWVNDRHPGREPLAASREPDVRHRVPTVTVTTSVAVPPRASVTTTATGTAPSSAGATQSTTPPAAAIWPAAHDQA